MMNSEILIIIKCFSVVRYFLLTTVIIGYFLYSKNVYLAYIKIFTSDIETESMIYFANDYDKNDIEYLCSFDYNTDFFGSFKQNFVNKKIQQDIKISVFLSR